MNDPDENIIPLPVGLERDRQRYIENHLTLWKKAFGPYYERMGEESFRPLLGDVFDTYVAGLGEETPESERLEVVGRMIGEIILLRMQRDGLLPYNVRP